jgi:poly(ADP-ribose) glycohydrolase
MKRELIKAYTCFRIPAALSDQISGVATGNWGCGAFNGNKQLKGNHELLFVGDLNWFFQELFN